MDNKLSDKSYYALHSWYYRFLARYSYSIRKPTHIRQKLKDNSGTELWNFYNILYNLRKNYERENNNIVIYNMDETLICFEMFANSTVAKIGSRNATIRSFGSDRARITIILCIGSNGEKIPPLVVFKGKKSSFKEKSLIQYISSKNYKIFALCQENAWADNFIFLYWLNNIFLNNKIIPNSQKKILILDRATTYYDKKLSEKLKKYNASYLLIPPGLTRFIHPLDVSINAPFKKFLHHWDTDYRINHLNRKKPDCFEIIDAIVSIWYNESSITKEIIIKSFKITGISINLNGSENHLVKKYDDLSEEIIAPDDALKEEEIFVWKILIKEMIGKLNFLNRIK